MRNVPSPSGLPVAGLACPGGAGLLRALPDPEGAESLWLLTLYANIGHDGLAGTVARPVHQVVNVFGWALEDCLDTAVGKVAHPSADAVLQRTPPTGVAEENTLNTARKHYPIADHKQTLRRGVAVTPVGVVLAGHGVNLICRTVRYRGCWRASRKARETAATSSLSR